jgi:uncharacterized membrane protein YdbT with pleckstrin-like domain
MSWIESNLLPGEKVVIETKPFWGPAYASIIRWLLVIGLIGYLADHGIAYPLLLFPLVTFLRYKKTEYILTDRRVIRKSGVLSVSTDEIPLDKVTNVRFGQEMSGRFSDSGDLLIESSARDGQLLFKNTNNIREFKAGIQQAQETFQDARVQHQAETFASAILAKQGVVASAPTPEQIHHTKKERLQELKGLLDDGLITVGEYENQRSTVLEDE